MWNDLASIDPRFAYKGERTRYLAFPLGGIGSGGFSISGSGRLIDWSIRNRPALQGYNGYSHFAIKAEKDGRLVDARVLNGPYDLNPSGAPGIRKMFDGFGHGANRQTLVGVPHFRQVDFYGRFPTADLVFKDERFPGGVRLTAMSPFIPHKDRDSSMPVAMFAFEIVNDTSEELTYTLAGTLGNHGANSGIHTFRQQDGIASLHLTSSDDDLALTQRGDLTIATDSEHVEHTDHHFRGQWFDDLAVYWKEFARPGSLPHRHYDQPRTSRHMSQQPEHATLGARVSVPAGERRTVRFVISWSFPHGDIYWAYRTKPDGPIPDRPTPSWKNYYATQWAGSTDSAAEALRRWDELTGRTLVFRDGLFGATLPAEVKDAASATLALLRTATCIRLENGELWAWEGQHTQDGSCEGSCTHVWNYQQALSHLFPAIERTLRETEFSYNQLPDGGLTFRQRLPLGSGFDIIGPCADGHFGAIIKTCREWKLSGDSEWLRRCWPHVKGAIEYAWSPDNADLWDPQETGILAGRQHQTLDMELFGPNSWLGSMYVAALLATAEMAAAMGDEALAGKAARLGRAGADYIDNELFNGRWFFQKIDISDKGVLAPFDAGRAGVLADGFMETYWSEEFGELKYQMGEGCISDQILGQWQAEVAGIGGFLDADKVRTALKSMHANNFRPTLEDHFNPCRNYAYEDEAGLLIATYPAGIRQPMVAAPYAEEVWTGIEYMAASHMIMHGLVEEGLDIVRGARDRHDGSRRNPWNDIECGSYYARSMSAWQLVNAFSGLSADLVRGSLVFAPRVQGDYRLFWSAGNGFGIVAREGDRLVFTVLGGSLDLAEITVDGKAHRFEGRRRLQAGALLELGTVT